MSRLGKQNREVPVCKKSERYYYSRMLSSIAFLIISLSFL